MIEFNEYLIPLVIGKPVGNGFHADRYAGIGFFIGKDLIATCKHVVEMVNEGEMLVGLDRVVDSSFEVIDIRCHPIYDFAIGTFPLGKHHKKFTLTPQKHFLGADVQAFGYTADCKDGDTVRIDARLFKGHIVRTSATPIRPDARSILEVSFASHKGFSGAPLVGVENALVGMLFTNLDSYVEHYKILDVDDGKILHKETAYRVAWDRP